MSIKTIETKKFVLKIHQDDYLESFIKEWITIDVELVLETKKAVEEHKSNTKFYVYAEGAGFFNVTPEARKLVATKEFCSHMAAVAFYTNNPSLLLLGKMYNKVNKPSIETKIFTDKNKAKKWLRSLMPQEKKTDNETGTELQDET